MTSLLISNIVLWIAVIALGVVVFALTRQIGVLYERVAPAGALVIDKGPAIGQTPPVFELRDLAGQAVKIGGIAADGRSTLTFFLSSTCPVCKQLLPAVRTMAASESRVTGAAEYGMRCPSSTTVPADPDSIRK